MSGASSGAAGAPTAPPEISYDFQLEIPEGFVELPDTEAAQEAWTDAVGTLLPGLPAESLGDAAAALRGTLAQRSPATTLRTAVCMGAEGEDVGLAILTVSVQHSGHDSAVVTAEALYRTYQDRFFADEARRPAPIDSKHAKGLRGEQDTLLAVRLPCGPGVSAFSLRSLTLPRPRRTVDLAAAGATDPAGAGGTDGAGDTDGAAAAPATDAVPGADAAPATDAAADGGGPPRPDRPPQPLFRPDQPFRLPVAILQLIVPAPDDYCVYLTMLTPTLKHLSSFSAQMSFLGRTLAFDAAARQEEARAG